MTYLQALTLTQMVFTSSVVESSSTSSSRWVITNLWQRLLRKPILLQILINLAFTFCNTKKKRLIKLQVITSKGMSGPGRKIIDCFTSYVSFCVIAFFTLFNAHLQPQHRPGGCAGEKRKQGCFIFLLVSICFFNWVSLLLLSYWIQT